MRGNGSHDNFRLPKQWSAAQRGNGRGAWSWGAGWAGKPSKSRARICHGAATVSETAIATVAGPDWPDSAGPVTGPRICSILTAEWRGAFDLVVEI